MSTAAISPAPNETEARLTRLTLIEKLIRVYHAVDHVEKSGRNTFQNYNYVRATDVARAIRNAFKDQGIYAQVQFVVLRHYTIPAREGEMQAVDVDCKICFWDSPSGEKMEINGLGTGADKGDKAMYKAQTGSVKYALRNAFLIPDEADPEADSKTDEETAPPPTTTKRQVSSAPAREGTSGTRIQKDVSPQSGQRRKNVVDRALEGPPDAIGADSSPYQATDEDIPYPIGPSDTIPPPQNEAPSPVSSTQSSDSDDKVVFEHGKLIEPYVTRAKKMVDTLLSVGLGASEKMPVGAKLKKYILNAHGEGEITQEALTAKQFNSAMDSLDILLKTESTKRHAADLVDSKCGTLKKGAAKK